MGRSLLVFFSQSHDGFFLWSGRARADTEGFYTAVQEKILARYGMVFDWSVKAKMMGKTTAESTRILFEECGLTGLLTPEEFLEERETMLKELLPTSVAMPGEEDSLPNFSASALWDGYITNFAWLHMVCVCCLISVVSCRCPTLDPSSTY
jgi:hypothetical protein